MENKQIKSFKDLIVWQKAMYLVKEIYQLTKSLPEEEKFGLISQMRRCAVSIPSNIAEGSKRSSRKDYRSFLRMAFGSTAELETQILLCKELEFISGDELVDAESNIEEISKILNTMLNKLKD